NRRADLLFAPGSWATNNLRKMKVKGRIVTLAANTGKDALDYTLALPASDQPPRRAGPYALATIHRFETVNRPDMLARAVDVVRRAAETVRMVWPLHTVTRRALQSAGLLEGLAGANVELCDVLPYQLFARLLAAAEFVIADGGSIQEESFFLDKPCLLLRRTTERREGLDENVVLSRWDAETIDAFLADPNRRRRRTAIPAGSISPVVVDELLAMDERLTRLARHP
ncbi:MAG: UDP-N-acetylglucosamine 2-epimerase, partial [Phycisphaerae bacterium]|nr:UDP-N-acetylglucosamine 2-epimerase [Phycisphaerae bacterium]